MRLALFTDTYYPETNGVSKTLQLLVKYLKKKGNQIKIVAPAYDHLEPSEDCWLVRSSSFFLYPSCQIAYPNRSEIESVMDSFCPDIIHVATPAGIGLSGRKYALIKGIPLIGSYHTNFDQYLTYYGFDLLEPLYWMYLKWFHSGCDINFCPSESTLKVLRRNGFKNLEIWTRGVDQDVFHPHFYSQELREAWGAKEKIVLLSVGRLAREKNIQLLFRAYGMMSEEIRKKLKMVIVGQGPEMEPLKDIAPEGTVFTGMLSGTDLSAAYASADIFTFTSHSETFGNVLLEAMASGVPVICPLAGGVLDILQEGKNGIGFQPDDPGSLADKIQKIVMHDAVRSRLSKGARNYALQQSWGNVFDNLTERYHDLISIYKLAEVQ